MRIYKYFQQENSSLFYVQKQIESQNDKNIIPEFMWVDCIREEIINDPEHWQKAIYELTGVALNEYHVKDILNLDHPCTFDTLEDYDLLIFRKLLTPDDQIQAEELPLEFYDRIFGVATTAISFILTPQVLITVREKGMHVIESHIARLDTLVTRPMSEQNKPRKLSISPLDLSLRLLNNMIDG